MKQLLWAGGLLAGLAIVFGLWARYSPAPVAPAAPAQNDPLKGVATSSSSLEHVEDTNVYNVDIVYPAQTPLSGTADAQARATMGQGLADLIAQFKQDGNFANLTPADIAYQNITPDHKYALGAGYKEYSGSGTVSYLFTVYEDTLGAHPNGFFKTFVFDTQGKELGLADLGLGGGYLAKLSQAATAQVTAQLAARLGADASASIFADGLSPNADNFQNFVIDGNTLVIEIPPYQAAAYAAGDFEVRIPLGDLK